MSNAFMYFVLQDVMSLCEFSADIDVFCGNVLSVHVLFDI